MGGYTINQDDKCKHGKAQRRMAMDPRFLRDAAKIPNISRTKRIFRARDRGK
jgi:hypothetical protein